MREVLVLSENKVDVVVVVVVVRGACWRENKLVVLGLK